MIALLGASGFVGSRFRSHLDRRGLDYVGISRSSVNLFDSKALATMLSATGATFLINCAGFTGKPNVDACENQKTNCLMANAALPGTVAEACNVVGIPFGHVSSGCIFTGRPNGRDGFTEFDKPNFSFRQGNCSFYSGTKALGEEILADQESCYIWRLRIPFDNIPHPRNYLQKLMAYETLLEAENSLSHLDEFVEACIDSFQRKVPYGIYNLTNPGCIRTSDVTRLIEEFGLVSRQFSFFRDEAEFMRLVAKTPRSNCVLDSSKAIDAGLRLSPIDEALRECLATWSNVDRRIEC